MGPNGSGKSTLANVMMGHPAYEVTGGRINDEEAFYLMSRGLARNEAEGMLIQGYFEELLDGAPADVGEHLSGVIQSRLEEKG